MKEYSILIVGISCYYGHVREFIVNLKKKNPNVKITLVTSPIPQDVSRELMGYVDRIIVHRTFKSKTLHPLIAGRINALYYAMQFLRLFFCRYFDIVDIHFARPSIKYALPILKRKTKNIVISPWGSDVMRVELEKPIMDMRNIYSQARFVTVGKDSKIGKCAIEKFHMNPNKMISLPWGGEFFDYIQENPMKINTEDAKCRFKLDGRYVITCGYNAQKQQRHEEIINAVQEIKKQLPDNITLLFPFNYGKKSTKRTQYISSVIEKCKTAGLDYVVCEDFLDMGDLLKLRMATDIFIHVQTTDAGSRSVMEYVLCNKKVVNGTWNRYIYLEKYKPSCYFPIDRIEDLGLAIVKAYNSPIGDLPDEVRDVILERGWNNRMTSWNSFFESIV